MRFLLTKRSALIVKNVIQDELCGEKRCTKVTFSATVKPRENYLKRDGKEGITGKNF